jgi:hypothetical protein
MPILAPGILAGDSLHPPPWARTLDNQVDRNFGRSQVAIQISGNNSTISAFIPPKTEPQDQI